MRVCIHLEGRIHLIEAPAGARVVWTAGEGCLVYRHGGRTEYLLTPYVVLLVGRGLEACVRSARSRRPVNRRREAILSIAATLCPPPSRQCRPGAAGLRAAPRYAAHAAQSSRGRPAASSAAASSAGSSAPASTDQSSQPLIRAERSDGRTLPWPSRSCRVIRAR